MHSTKFKLIAMDLDGTLTQHKSKMTEQVKTVLDKLGEKYKLVIVGAGGCKRIYNQMDKYEIDILGYYGMQTSYVDANSKKLIIKTKIALEVNKDETINLINDIRKKTGYEKYNGDSVEFHPNGAITFPLLGTNVDNESKLSFDPNREKRRKILDLVKDKFVNQSVFIGGSSSFDIVPKGVNKLSALLNFAESKNIDFSEIIYFGDDYGLGGNDEDIYLSNIEFVCIDDYRLFPQKVDFLLSDNT